MNKIAAFIATTVLLSAPTAFAKVGSGHLQQQSSSSVESSFMQATVSSSISSIKKASSLYANRKLQDTADFQVLCDALESGGDFQCTCDSTTFTATCDLSDICDDQGNCVDIKLVADFDSTFAPTSIEVCIEDVGASAATETPVGACITLEYSGEVIDSCAVELKDTSSSSYEQCNSCAPCTDDSGAQSFDIDCTNFGSGSDFTTNGCLSTTASTDGSMNSMNLESVVGQLQSTDTAGQSGQDGGSGANSIQTSYLMPSLVVGGIMLAFGL